MSGCPDGGSELSLRPRSPEERLAFCPVLAPCSLSRTPRAAAQGLGRDIKAGTAWPDPFQAYPAELGEWTGGQAAPRKHPGWTEAGRGRAGLQPPGPTGSLTGRAAKVSGCLRPQEELLASSSWPPEASRMSRRPCTWPPCAETWGRDEARPEVEGGPSWLWPLWLESRGSQASPSGCPGQLGLSQPPRLLARSSPGRSWTPRRPGTRRPRRHPRRPGRKLSGGGAPDLRVVPLHS